MGFIWDLCGGGVTVKRVYDLLPSRSELETKDEKNQNIERVQFPSDKQMKL